jgi:O-antigen/teichoic acid export membrane protein
VITRGRTLISRFVGERGLIRSSAVVFAGNAAARLFGFLFYISAARLLEPADYGTLAYALAVLATASIFLTNSPGGLARFIARNVDNRERQDYYYSNWIALTAVMFIVSTLLFIPFIPVARLTTWLAVGVVVNLANIAIFETYVQTQRGLGRFTVMGVYYTLANFLQLVAILIAGLLGWRSASLFLLLYGFSAIAGVALMRLAAPTPLSFRLKAVSSRQMRRIARYVAPILAQGLFFSVWWSADLILINRLLSATAAGNYAAAKTLTQALTLTSSALIVAAGPRLSRLSEAALRKQIFRLLGLASVAILPPAVLLMLLQGPVTELAYGSKYSHVLDAFNALVVGVVLYGYYLVLASVWGALGRPLVGAITTALGAVTTVVLALLLIPAIGLLGGGIAYAAGAGAQLVFVIAFTTWGLFWGGSARFGHLPDEDMLAGERPSANPPREHDADSGPPRSGLEGELGNTRPRSA